jgi:two-component system cell cycle sensor histidine kinase/response regulator CckA
MSEPLRVLLVEDSPSDAKLVSQALGRIGRPLELERVETAEAMRAALSEKTWDLVISDWSMPKFTAPGALALLRSFGLDLPFIIVSGTIGEETAADAMRTGANDYVLKDKLGRLVPAVERELRECKERAERRRAEDALRQSEARYRRLAESGVIGIIIRDVNGSILDANDAYAKMVGYSREQLLEGGLRWTDLTPPELRHLDEQALTQLEATGVASPWETESLRSDGIHVPVLVGMAMLDHPRCIAFMVDLSGRKRAEAGRALAEAALRRSEEQLRQAQKMEAVGRLAGGVAHDFNNVLSVILSYAELILAGLKANDPLGDDIGQIRSAAARAAGLTRQLLMFSRHQVFEPRVLDLNEVLAGMEKMLQRILGEDVELVFVNGKSSGYVRTDPSHIEQVILNLVVNARDAMPTGGKLTVGVSDVVLEEDFAASHVPARAGAYVMLAVSDTGTGIDKATQARIFEPFFTTKELGKGTGLGLSTVFGIVQQSGGHIGLFSEPGLGTTFEIYLPRVDAAKDVAKAQIEPSTLRGTETILLVEDEEQVRVVAAQALRRQGYRVLPAQHAGEALLLCERFPDKIDLLVTDVVMPQMSGPELARRLDTVRPDLKVLFMSGYTDDSIIRHGVVELEFAYIQKPITPATLTKKVREVLDRVR